MVDIPAPWSFESFQQFIRKSLSAVYDFI